MIDTLECAYLAVPKPEKMVKLKVQTLEALLQPFVTWSSEDPGVIVNTGPFKVRRTYFTVLASNFHLIQMFRMIGGLQLNRDVDAFIDQYSQKQFGGVLTTRTDIQKADDLTFRVLSQVDKDLLLRAAKRCRISDERMYEIFYSQAERISEIGISGFASVVAA